MRESRINPPTATASFMELGLRNPEFKGLSFWALDFFTTFRGLTLDRAGLIHPHIKLFLFPLPSPQNRYFVKNKLKYYNRSMTAKSDTPHDTDNLHRSETNRIVAGVAGGLGEYFNIDPTIVRILFILLTIFGGSGVLIYIILWLIIPSGNNPSNLNFKNKEEIRAKVHQFAHDLRGTSNTHSRVWLGFILIILGLLFFANNLGIFYAFDLSRLWPLILILLGISLLGRR